MLSLGQVQLAAIDREQDRRFRMDLVDSLGEEDVFTGVHPLIVETLCEHALARAREYGLTTQSDLSLFVHLMAGVSATFDLQPEIHDGLTRTDVAIDDRLTRVVEGADELTWTLAEADDGRMGWYLRCDGFGRDEAERITLAIAEALPAEDLPAPEVRLGLVTRALQEGAAAGFVSPSARWVWAASTLAYGEGFRTHAPWAADVFAPGSPVPRQEGLLRVRMALDFGAWI